MGGTDSKETETIVKNEVSIEIENQVRNLNKIMNETVTSSSTSTVNETSNKIATSNSVSNKLKTGALVAKGKGSKIDLSQDAKVKTQNEAIMQIMSNSQAMSDMQSKIQSDLLNKTKNDSAAQASLDTLNSIKKTETSAGGPEALVKSVMESVNKLGSALTGASSKDSQKTMIQNDMKTKIKNTTENSNDITNIIKNSTNSFASNLQKSECKMDTAAANEMEVASAMALDGGEIKIAQAIDLTAFNKCVVQSVNTNEIINKITGDSITGVVNDTINKNSADSKQKSKTDLAELKENKSGFMEFLSTAMTGSVVMFLGVLVVGGLAIYLVMNFASENPDIVSQGLDKFQKYMLVGGANNSSDIIIQSLIIIFLFCTIVMN